MDLGRSVKGAPFIVDDRGERGASWSWEEPAGCWQPFAIEIRQDSELHAGVPGKFEHQRKPSHCWLSRTVDPKTAPCPLGAKVHIPKRDVIA